METPKYLHLAPGDTPPLLGQMAPFKAVVIIEAEVTPEWRNQVSDWLVHSGCLYMIAWGKDCSDWDDSVDWANIDAFNYEEIPEDAFVMTTWHEDEPLEETLRYCVLWAIHPSVDIKETYIMHISPNNRETEILEIYRESQLREE